MAKDEKSTMLSKMTDNRLGSVPVMRDVPGDLRDPGEGVVPAPEQGRRPEDVVLAREPVQTTTADDEPKVPEKKWKVGGEDLTLEEIAARGLMEKLITSAQQLPGLQDKYQKVLEERTGKEVAKPEAAKPPEPITQAQIRQAYDPVVREWVKLGYIEADLAEAYPDFVANSAFRIDQLETVIEKLTHVISWIQAEAGKRSVDTVQAMLDSAIDAVAGKLDKDGKPHPLFAPLREKGVRSDFVNWLRREIDPKVATLNPEGMERFWLTYKASDLLDFTEKAAEKKIERPTVRKARGDGSPTRQGTEESPKEKGLLERMSDQRLGAEA